MQFLTKGELRRLFQVAYQRNRLHHLALVVGLWHGLRVSETTAITARDIADGQISVKRLKGSRSTIDAIRRDADPLFDESPLLEMAQAHADRRLFPFSRQRVDQFVKKYARLAGIHPDKAHYHVLKHSLCVMLWDSLHDLNAIQDRVGHKSSSSTLAYMRSEAAAKAEAALSTLVL